MAFNLPPLPYAFDALEPAIDAETMEMHHDKHHRAYVDALNKAIAPYPEYADVSVEELLRALDDVPDDIRDQVRNQGGGHANHELFWKVIQPGGAKKPTGDLSDAIDAAFGGFDALKKQFEEAGTKHFGSGWAMLVTDPKGKGLEILTVANQDTPVSTGKTVLLLNDLWEHAYYLTYKNLRPKYLHAFWDVVNWSAVSARFDAVRAGDMATLSGPAS